MCGQGDIFANSCEFPRLCAQVLPKSAKTGLMPGIKAVLVRLSYFHDHLGLCAPRETFSPILRSPLRHRLPRAANVWRAQEEARKAEAAAAKAGAGTPQITEKKSGACAIL